MVEGADPSAIASPHGSMGFRITGRFGKYGARTKFTLPAVICNRCPLGSRLRRVPSLMKPSLQTKNAIRNCKSCISHTQKGLRSYPDFRWRIKVLHSIY